VELRLYKERFCGKKTPYQSQLTLTPFMNPSPHSQNEDKTANTDNDATMKVCRGITSHSFFLIHLFILSLPFQLDLPQPLSVCWCSVDAICAIISCNASNDRYNNNIYFQIKNIVPTENIGACTRAVMI
jgi:hypothetical protein